MSFVITMYVREGIVMAADSRLTINTTQTQAQGQIVTVSVPQSDSNNKAFLAPNNIGILTCGKADIGGVPIAGYIETFISNNMTGNIIDIDRVSQLLLNYFRQFQPIPDTQFYVAGYKDNNGQRAIQLKIFGWTSPQSIPNQQSELITPPKNPKLCSNASSRPRPTKVILSPTSSLVPAPPPLLLKNWDAGGSSATSANSPSIPPVSG